MYLTLRIRKPEGYEPSINVEPMAMPEPVPAPPPMEARPGWRQVRNRVRRVRNGGSGVRPPHIPPQAPPVAAAPVHIPAMPYPGVQPGHGSWNLWHRKFMSSSADSLLFH